MYQPKPQEAVLRSVRKFIHSLISTKLRRSLLELELPHDEHNHDAQFIVRQFLAKAPTEPQAKGKVWPGSCVVYICAFLVVGEPSLRVESAHVGIVPNTAAVVFVCLAAGAPSGFFNLETRAQEARAIGQHVNVRSGRDAVSQDFRIHLCDTYRTRGLATSKNLLYYGIKVWYLAFDNIVGTRVRPSSSSVGKFSAKDSTKLLLDLRIICQVFDAPSDCRRRCVVSCNKKSKQIVFGRRAVESY